MMRKIAYLTIDDAPSADFGKKIDFLQSRSVPAIFFCQGNALESYPEISVEAIQRGFVIGNHAYDHPHFSEIALETCFEQIRLTDEIIANLYDRAGVANHAKYFRFPYGDKGSLTGDDVLASITAAGIERKRTIQNYLLELGYSLPAFEGIRYKYYLKGGFLDDVDWYWTYDVHEWSMYSEQPVHGIETVEDIFTRMDEVVPEGGRGLNTPGSAEIILIHDHVETTEIFFAVVDRMLEKDLVFCLPS
jgi:peptidoglycan/xylan/chitin deacetylase (PgdA/CDA1 family)